MLVVGIDPGTAITGYGFVCEDDEGKITTVDFGVITTSPDQPMPQRLHELHQQLSSLILLHQPESGAVEKLFFQKNVRTALAVGQARGVALLTLAEGGIPVSEYTPLEIKQAVTGYGGADKNQVQKMVRTLLGLSSIPQPDDAADALAIAICHLHSQRFTQLFPAA